jgi:SAM-dependent methyltransferase
LRPHRVNNNDERTAGDSVAKYVRGGHTVNWRIKGLIQKALAHVPGGQRLNSRLQLHLGGLRNFEKNVDSKVRADWLVIADHMRALSMPIADRTLLEIGTGWFPALPVCFSLVGAARCISYDLSRLLDFRLTQRMLVRLETHLKEICDKTGCSERLLRDRLSQLQAASGIDDFLQRARIEYHAPADATATELPDGSIDIVFSNSVLEHVTLTALDALMRETRRILAPAGVAIHSVNCGDHYAYFDRRLSPINYLRYTESRWRFWNNDIQYQNRLRPNDFLASAERAGLELLLNKQRPRPELLATLDSLGVAPEFGHYSREQLCTTSIDFVAKTPGGQKMGDSGV